VLQQNLELQAEAAEQISFIAVKHSPNRHAGRRPGN
jgi:hypothetical protein